MAKKHTLTDFSKDVRDKAEATKARARRLQDVKRSIQQGTYDEKKKLTSAKVVGCLLTDMRR